MRNLGHIAIQILIVILCSYVINNFIIVDAIYFNTYAEVLSKERIADLIKMAGKYQWLSYTFAPVMILLKLFLTTVVLFIGLFFTDCKIKFKRLFVVVTMAEYVFSLSIIMNTAILYFKGDVTTILDIQNFQSFSMLNFFDYKAISQWAIYPLKTLNLFEVTYIVMLGYFLSKELGLKFSKATEAVLIPYVLGLCIWVVFFVFLVVSFT